MKSDFLNSVFAYKGKKDFVVTDLKIKVLEFEQFIKENRSQMVNDEFNISVLKSKKDPDKFYTKYVIWDAPKQVTASEQMPDRETVHDDLPF